MKKLHSKNELNVDFIQSKPLTKEEEKSLSEFIKKLKAEKSPFPKGIRTTEELRELRQSILTELFAANLLTSLLEKKRK